MFAHDPVVQREPLPRCRRYPIYFVRHDAKCGFACHTVAKTRDYVFTEYGKR
jgi:hypothetical protein